MDINKLNDSAYKAAFRAGVVMGCAANEVGIAEYMKKTAKVELLDSSLNMQKAIAKIAHSIFSCAGDEYMAERNIYAVIGDKEYNLTPFSKAAYLKPVIDTLAEFGKAEGDMEKDAFFGPLKRIFGGALSYTPEIVQLAALLSVAGGSAAGATTWALGRDSTEQTADAEVKDAQAQYYRDLAREIKRKLKKNSIHRKTGDKATEEAIRESIPDGFIV